MITCRRLPGMFEQLLGNDQLQEENVPVSLSENIRSESPSIELSTTRTSEGSSLNFSTASNHTNNSYQGFCITVTKEEFNGIVQESSYGRTIQT